MKTENSISPGYRKRKFASKHGGNRHLYQWLQWQNFRPGTRHQWAGSFRLVSWNVNADAALLKFRMPALLQTIKTTGAVDAAFLQEVSKDTLRVLLEGFWIRKYWYTSDVDASAFGNQKFISITQVSNLWVATNGILLGAIWRISLPSRFGRDTLCRDLILDSSNKNISGRSSLRIRLINVHLDLLPINPSLRPRPLSICSSQLAAGSSLATSIPFFQKTTTLSSPTIWPIAWAHLYTNEPGYTWGVYGQQSFPPSRLDKVALSNLSPSSMGILRKKNMRTGTL